MTQMVQKSTFLTSPPKFCEQLFWGTTSIVYCHYLLFVQKRFFCFAPKHQSCKGGGVKETGVAPSIHYLSNSHTILKCNMTTFPQNDDSTFLSGLLYSTHISSFMVSRQEGDWKSLSHPFYAYSQKFTSPHYQLEISQ